MKTILTTAIIFTLLAGGYTQIIIPVEPHTVVETSRNGQEAIRGYSGPIGDIVPPTTNPANIGVVGIGFHGVKGFARGAEGAGIYGLADKGTYGVYGYSEDDDQSSVYGLSPGGRGVVGESFSNQGVAGICPFGEGVYGESETGPGVKAYSLGWYGLEVSSGNNGALFSCADGAANIVLSGSDSPWGGGNDDAVIRTQLGQSGGDMILVTNDVLSIHLDDDNNTANEGFHILNGADEAILTLDASGNLVVAGSYDISSDRNRKEKIRAINPDALLEKVIALPISEWQYKDSNDRHIGPMAQDFYAAFGLGSGETTISSVDAHGVALAAIKALAERLHSQEVLLERQGQLLLDLISRNDIPHSDHDQQAHLTRTMH